jgi:hypothetical protein
MRLRRIAAHAGSGIGFGLARSLGITITQPVGGELASLESLTGMEPEYSRRIGAA